MIGDLIYRITDNSFELYQDLQTNDGRVSSITASKDENLLIIGSDNKFNIFKKNGDNYVYDHNINIGGWKNIYISDDSKYFISGLNHTN